MGVQVADGQTIPEVQAPVNNVGNAHVLHSLVISYA